MRGKYEEQAVQAAGKEDLVVGIDVGGMGLKGVVIDYYGHVLAQEYRPTMRERGPAAVVESILAFASDLAKETYEGQRRVVAAGVVVPGLVDEEAGVARQAVNLGWKDVPLRILLGERLGLPVVVGHDVRAGGVAEGLLGAGRNCTNYMFATLGTGVGAIIVLRGVPYLGLNGVAGEFGHIVVQPDGPLCSCGLNGCVEALASASAVAKRYQELTGEQVSARDVAERAVAGDEAASKIWGEAI